MTIALPADRLLAIYRSMLLIRQFEEQVRRLAAAGAVPGLVHLCAGQEATAVGICDALAPDDVIASSHRGHGHCLAKGAAPDRLMAEILGRQAGYCRGRSGSLHVSDAANFNLGTNGIVGGGVPLATGAALSAKVRGTGQVAVCFFGDGALNRGAFHEAVNLAAVWRLPVVYACIDNGWAISVPRAAASAGELPARAAAYGIPGVVVDGKDVVACHAAAGEAIARARAGEGPTVLFFDCPRGYGHEEGDNQEYRDPADVAAAEARDPLALATAGLTAAGLLDAADVERLDAEAAEVVAAAVAFALASPEPDPADAFRHVLPSDGAAR
jgi:acetoin:2,6-dichlorophenolindophenol oxidoreductase subunit alpha